MPELIRPLPIRRRTYRKRPRLLAHYPAVVEFIYSSRFATGFHVRRRFSQYMASERTAQYQLASLVQLGYLDTAPVRSTSPNFPYVYFATGRGVRLIGESYARLGHRWSQPATETNRSKGVALTSIMHELLVTEFDLAVWQTLSQRTDLQRLFVERRYFQRDKRLQYSHDGGWQPVIPDSGFLLQMLSQTSGRLGASLLLHLVELDNGTMPLRRIRQKLEHYDAWARSDEGCEYLRTLYRQYDHRPKRLNFRLLIIAHASHSPGGDDRRLADLLTEAARLPRTMRDRIWLTTATNLRAHQADTSCLSSPLWYRAKNAARIQSLDRTSGPHTGANATTAQRDLATHALFPTPTND